MIKTRTITRELNQKIFYWNFNQGFILYSNVNNSIYKLVL